MLRRLYFWWMETVLDRHVCKEFTRWEIEIREYTRPVEPGEVISSDYNNDLATIAFSRRYQSRKCTICGKVEQQRLEL